MTQEFAKKNLNLKTIAEGTGSPDCPHSISIRSTELKIGCAIVPIPKQPIVLLCLDPIAGHLWKGKRSLSSLKKAITRFTELSIAQLQQIQDESE